MNDTTTDLDQWELELVGQPETRGDDLPPHTDDSPPYTYDGGGGHERPDANPPGFGIDQGIELMLAITCLIAMFVCGYAVAYLTLI